MMPMALVLSACLWSGIALTAGLIVGSGWLRVGGICGLVVFGVAAWLLARFSEPRVCPYHDDCDLWAYPEDYDDYFVFEWPERSGERTAS